MQSAMRIAVSFCLLSSALAAAYHNGAKLRRDGVLNLYPFPRVGRASHRTWQVPINDLFWATKYDNNGQMVKRQMYAFPRVGRGADAALMNNLSPELAMPVRRTDSPGMWFGPRLGRSFNSDDDDITIRAEQSEPEQTEERLERKKRQSDV